MKTWLSNYFIPQLVALIGLIFFFIPGLIFILWGWGKYKCPHCGALGRNAPAASNSQGANAQRFAIDEDDLVDKKTCPFCAERILAAAIKCKHCGSSLGVGAAVRDEDGIFTLNLNERRLCPDGNCVGTLGTDGRCRVCGAQPARGV